MESSLTNSIVPEAPMPDDVGTLQALLKAERMRNADLTSRVATSVQMKLAYQQYVPQPPAPKEALWKQACTNDEITSESWRDTWLKHIERNVTENDADNHMVSDEFAKHALKPVICVASGPSLKKNVERLKDAGDIPIISCLHNFGLLTDLGIKATYVTLDAGQVVIPEMTEGGKKDKEYYLEASKECTLIAGLVSPPELIKMWRGETKFFNATIPDKAFMERMPQLTKNKWVYSVGGNTFGAAMYHAAWVWGCNPLALVGADFSFDYMHKFHSWDSAYDKQFAGVVPCTDVYGNRVYSWPSYQNFRAWTEFQAMGGQSQHNLQIINCTEGGTLGAYPHGNIMQVKQLRLQDFLDGYLRHKKLGDWVEQHKDVPEYTVMW